jgi:hypothetical protein
MDMEITYEEVMKKIESGGLQENHVAVVWCNQLNDFCLCDRYEPEFHNGVFCSGIIYKGGIPLHWRYETPRKPFVITKHKHGGGVGGR